MNSESEYELNEINGEIGKLRTNSTLTLHTHQATKIWNGKKYEDGNVKIMSMPNCLSIIANIHHDSARNDPYADMALLELERQITEARKEIAGLVDKIFDIYANKIPDDISIQDSFNVNPVKISLMIHSQIGFLLIYLLSEYDAMVRSVMTAAHLALIPRLEARAWLDKGSKPIRRIYTAVQRYRAVRITRDDVLQKNARALAAIEKYGEVPEDIFCGMRRSQYAPYVDLSKYAANVDKSE
ncbi:PFL_4669 family integrating conjugative element protein [Pasteurella testudinis]|uniref:PFL_4669 family integrating conjugative element protein n=1 Tax=Pasteurella testudinis TaxID=761 RepID=UPI00405806E2